MHAPFIDWSEPTAAQEKTNRGLHEIIMIMSDSIPLKERIGDRSNFNQIKN